MVFYFWYFYNYVSVSCFFCGDFMFGKFDVEELGSWKIILIFYLFMVMCSLFFEKLKNVVLWECLLYFLYSLIYNLVYLDY